MLREAAELVDEVIKALEGDSTICGACGLVKYSNFTDHNDKLALAAMSQKLRRISSPKRGR